MVFKKTASKPEPKMRLVVNNYLCQGCGACVAVCPPDALFLTKTHLAVDQGACTACERCLRACPSHALSLAEIIPV